MTTRAGLSIFIASFVVVSALPAEAFDATRFSCPIQGRVNDVDSSQAGDFGVVVPKTPWSVTEHPEGADASDKSESVAASVVQASSQETSNPAGAGTACPASSPTARLRWSLPISGLLQRSALPKAKPTKLDASLCYGDAPSRITATLDELMDSALERDGKSADLEKAVSHYRKRSQRIIAGSKDACNYMIPYRGFGPSIEASDIILGEKLKVKSRSAAEYARQKQIDETHIRVVSSMMQIAMGMGMADQTKGYETAQSGLESLKKLAGEDEARNTMAMLSSWKESLMVPESLYSQDPWDVKERQDRLEKVLTTAVQNDAVVHQITKALHKYNQKSKLSRVSSQVIQTSLGVASLTPTFVGPAAKLTLLGYIMATGGPEQNKLLKQLYLDKRLDSRTKVLSEEAHMALENYQLGLLTKNDLLIAFSESLIQEMTDETVVGDVFGRSVFQGPSADSLAASSSPP